MFAVICYDIPSNQRRTRVGKVLEGFGSRVQQSVFECDLTPKHYERLRRRLARIIRAEEDRVRFYTLCAGCRERIEVVGAGEVEKTPLLYVV